MPVPHRLSLPPPDIHTVSDSPAPSGLFAELKRRRVLRVTAVYAVASWVVIQVAVNTFPALQLPDWTVTFVVVLALLGMPITLVLAWAFQITPEGFRRTESSPQPGMAATASRRLDARAAGWIGVGILAGLVFVGAYGWFSADAAEGDPAITDRTIAVLPFANMSAIQENEYFSDGITEDILTQLALIRELSVVSRTSVMKYKGTTLSMPEIGRELGVAYILEGSVRRVGDRVLITAQLIDAAADQHVWAESYDRDLTDIFAVQGDVSAAIARELQASLTPGEQGRIHSRPTDNIEAYDLVLRGRELIGKSRAQNESAVEIIKQAIRLDPGYADAYSALSGAYMQRVQLFGFPPVWADSGVALARRAIELTADNAAAHSVLGANLVQLGRSREAHDAYERSLELNPNSSTALNNLGSLEARRGRLDLAFPLLFKARKLDPRSSYPALNLASGYAAVGDRDAALRWLERAADLGHPPVPVRALQATLELHGGRHDSGMKKVEALLTENPEDFIAGYAVAWGAAMTGRWERLHEVSESLHRIAPEARPGDEPSVRYFHAAALWRTGERARAAELMQTLLHAVETAWSRGEGIPTMAYEAAGVLALQGRADEAMAWLARAYEAGFLDADLARMDPSFESLRPDPRFQTLLARIDTEVRAMREQIPRLETVG